MYYIAQVNIGRIKAPIDSPLIGGFTGRLNEVNAGRREPGLRMAPANR
jgi:Domain of unknown function (DUF3291)